MEFNTTYLGKLTQKDKGTLIIMAFRAPAHRLNPPLSLADKFASLQFNGLYRISPQYHLPELVGKRDRHSSRLRAELKVRSRLGLLGVQASESKPAGVDHGLGGFVAALEPFSPGALFRH